jgi:lauroyl/myristoyl acyltransferase
MMPSLLSLASRAALLTPPRFDRPLAEVAGRLWCAADRGRRAAVHGNRSALRARFPLHAPFVHHLEALAGWLRLLGSSRASVLARSSVEGWGSLLGDTGRGTVLVAAHVGEWEWGAAALAARGLEVVAVAGTQMNPAWNPALARAKLSLGIKIVGPAQSPARLVRALRRGAVVALLVDGDVATARRPAALGAARAELPLGPARLAARAGARLVAGRCERDGARYRVRLTALDRGLARGDESARFEAVRGWLTSTLAEDPGRWCLFRPFFSLAPPAAQAPLHAAGGAVPA